RRAGGIPPPCGCWQRARPDSVAATPAAAAATGTAAEGFGGRGRRSAGGNRGTSSPPPGDGCKAGGTELRASWGRGRRSRDSCGRTELPETGPPGPLPPRVLPILACRPRRVASQQTPAAVRTRLPPPGTKPATRELRHRLSVAQPRPVVRGPGRVRVPAR